MRLLAVLFAMSTLLALTACAGAPPPGIITKTVQVNVPIPVRCIDPAKVPIAPPAAALTGDSAHDIDELARTDLGLRSALDTALALIGPCTVDPISTAPPPSR